MHSECKNIFRILEDNNGTSSNFIQLQSAVVKGAMESIPTRKMKKEISQ